MPLKFWLTTTFNLGIAAAIFHVMNALALQDIVHPEREPDLRLEFWIVRISLLLTALFIASALRTVTLVRRTQRG
ncbi:MAG: hypothetical protein EPO35_00230 [Acidobacteria bacterium]|nr:MAG: hypothetical protein EPO35_00230 [Acidobacteriota bacterium]